jgi:hypothetical protein
MRRNHHYATILVGVVVAAALVLVIWRGGSSSSDTDPSSPGSKVPGVSSEASETSAPAQTSAPTPSSSASSDSDELARRSTQLIEQYFLLEPTDTPQTRQNRLEMLQVPANVIDGLDLTTGTYSCSDTARLNAADPLVQRAVVADGSAERTEYQDEAGNTVVFLAVPIQLALYHADDTPYSDDSTCVTSSFWTVGLTWMQRADDTWVLTSLVSPEGGSL